MQEAEGRGSVSRAPRQEGGIELREASMLQTLRRSVVALGFGLPLMLLAIPLRAELSRALGTLRSASTVQLDRLPARGECTLYSGDRVSTEASPAIVSFRRGDLLVLDRESRAIFQLTEGGLVVDLERGNLSFMASSTADARVESEGLTFIRAGSFPSLAEVALRDDGSLVLAVRRGTVAVRNLRPEPVVVQAGQYLRVGPPGAQVVGTAAHGKPSFGEKLRTFQIGGLGHAASAVLLGGAVGVLAAAAIAVPLAIQPPKASPSAP